MKRRLSFVLILCFLLCLISSPASAARVTHAQKVLAKEGPEAFWELVTPSYSQSMYLQQGYSQLTIFSPDGPAFPAHESDDYQPQVHYTVRFQETAGTGFTVEQVTAYYSEPYASFVTFDLTGDLLSDGPVYIPAYGSFSYGAGSPRAGNPRYEVLVVAGTDDNGHELEFYGIIERLNYFTDAASASNENPEYDTQNLRLNASFEVAVSDGVWWVPVSSLGGSHYTNSTVAASAEASPEQKQSDFSTLYEALQLFQITNFCTGDDNIRIAEDGIDWEHHKPGYDAVRTNTGCCATDSNWLNYILRGDYEEVGFLAYSQADGSGHILNYIKHEGFYYFIDLTHYRTDFLESSAVETGSLTDYRRSDFIAGNLHKAESPEAYIRYCVDSFNNPPSLFFLYQEENCLPVTGQPRGGKMTIIYPNTTDIAVYPGANSAALAYEFVDPPKKSHDWASVPSAGFPVDERYLTESSDESASEPLSSYRVDDVLSLADYGENCFAEIDGRDYIACQTETCWFSFEPAINLYGGNHYSYIGQTLPVELHGAQLASMDSIYLGDLMVDVLHRVDDVEIIRCVQNGDQLTVTEVLSGVYNTYEPMYMTKNSSGAWQPTDKIWYLIHYRLDDEIMYEFGRFYCD